MSPKYKVNYVNARGLAEALRWLLAYSGEEFEDIRHTWGEWLSIKPTVPFGKLPFLEVDGKKASQSVALARYLGKQAGLGGNDAWEDLQIDIFVDTFRDLREEMTSLNIFYEKVKAEKKEKFVKESVPFYMEKFDVIVKENNGYVANGKLSWGDIYFICMTDSMSIFLGSDILTPYSNLAALKKRTTSIPNIKAWIDKRPKTEL